MRKIVLTYGFLAAVIVTLLMVIWGSLSGSEFSHSYTLGYAGMIVSLSMIFFAIRNYRDGALGGRITFGKAFLVGLGVTFVASILYVIGWKIYSSIAMPNFMDQYVQSSIASLRKSGASETTILAKTKELNDMKEMYKNPLVEYGFTFLEIFPVGLVVSLICSLILRRKPAQPVESVSMA